MQTNPTSKIAVTASTGQLGTLVLGHLLKRVPAEQVIAISRQAGPHPAGPVETRKGDYNDAASYESALQGVDVLLLISSSDVGKRTLQHQNVIQAAVKAGVHHLVYTSILHADTTTLNLGEEHRASEEAVRASGLPFTLLRNGWYAENYTASVPAAVMGGAFLGSAGEGAISSAPRTDYAEAAAVVLTQPGHEGRIYELAGDSAHTLGDLAAEISRQTGKTIPYMNLPEADYAAKLLSFGLPKPLADGLASWDVGASQGALFDDSHQLSSLLGHPTGSLADAVGEALAAMPA